MSLLSPVGELVRRHDPDRFLTALFAPADKREALFTLYAFNHELARAREVASEPTLALIRLQWWREVVEGAPRRHEVATPLSQAIASGALSASDLLAVIEAREAEAEPSIPTRAAWRAYVLGNAGGLSVAAARLLGAEDPEAFRPAGAAYGAAGLLRSTAALARQGRCLLPADVLGAHGLLPDAVIGDPFSPSLSPVRAELAAETRSWLAALGSLPRCALAAALPAVLAKRDLLRLDVPPAPRGLGDRLAVMSAAALGKV